MRMYLLKLLSVLLFSLVLFLGCGGGSGGGGTTTQDDVIPEAKSSSDFLFPEMDVDDLLANPPDTIIRTSSSNAEIITVRTEKEKVEMDKDSLINESEDGSMLIFSSLIDLNTSKIGLPLFVDDTFKGMISDARIAGSTLVVRTQDATKISDVYKNFDVTFQNDSIVESVQRSLSSQNIKGRYDYLNKNPLRISVLKKSITNSRNLTNDEIVLRIDIPKGYTTPIDMRSVSCSFFNLDCSLTTEGNTSKNLDLGKSYGDNGLMFSTEGSYIEIGIGTYLRAHYDYNYIGVDTFDFDLAQSAYFESNLKVTLSGELSKSWEAPLKLIDDFEVEIVHPHSLEIKTTVIVSPQIVLGVDGKITGTFTASSFTKRSGEVRVSYNSANGAHSFDHSVEDTPQNISKDEVALSIEADGNAYVFPAITMLPTLTFARIGPSLTMVNLRSGIKLNTNINGKIETGFVVENKGEITQSVSMEASLTTSLEGLIQGQWLVRIAPLNLSDMEKCYAFSSEDTTEVEEISNHGDTDACFILYQSKDFTDIFSTEKLNVLEWKATLLNTPVIDVQEHPGDYSKRDVSFEIDIDEKVQTKVHFYYTLGGSDIPIEGIKLHASVWKLGDAPLEIDKNTKVKVRAVLYNEDISTSIWAWGTSVSIQSEELISLINKPDVTPTSKSFEDSLWINMSQDQGYDIMYQLDSAAAVKYSVPIEINEDATIVVYASDTVDGLKVYSQETTYEYDKCEEDEKLEGGECEELITLINKPDITPTNSSFEDSLWIHMSQDQGYDIMYKLDSATTVKYVGSFEIEKDTTLIAYARNEVDGVKVYSQETTYEYDKCEENEKLEGEECVLKGDYITSLYYVPTQTVCESGGGTWVHYINRKDECRADWDKASSICEMPSIEIWRNIITGCGGIIDETAANRENDTYQQCYKDLGYLNYSPYWSSTSIEDTTKAWFVNFSVGYHNWTWKKNTNFVRCIR